MIEKRKKDNKSGAVTADSQKKKKKKRGAVTVSKGPNGLSYSFQVFSQIWKYCYLVGPGENTLHHRFSLPKKQVKTKCMFGKCFFSYILFAKTILYF